MTNTPYTPLIRSQQNAAIKSKACVMNYLRLTFLDGPKKLFTARISAKCAALMAMMCSPSLLLCAVLTLPGLIFQNPQQNAYFHFANMVNQEPGRWFVLLLAGICVVMSMAVPAMSEQSDLTAAY
jgi:hypothetical protein